MFHLETKSFRTPWHLKEISDELNKVERPFRVLDLCSVLSALVDKYRHFGLVQRVVALSFALDESVLDIVEFVAPLVAGISGLVLLIRASP